MKKSKAIIQIVLMLAIVAVVVLLSNKLYFRLDFTADKRYTLNEATKQTLRSLEDVITVKAYFTENLPAQLIRSRTDIVDLLAEYESVSRGNVVYEIINPNESEEKEAEVQQLGISPLLINVREKDQVQQIRAYMGAVVEMGEDTEVIPLFQPETSAEYPLTRSIKKIAVLDKPKIAIIGGHGEASMQELAQVSNELSILYDIESYELKDDEEIPLFYKTVAMISPKDTISPVHFQKLDTYLKSGGNLFVAFNKLGNDLQGQYLSTNPDIGIDPWLRSKGVNVSNAYVVDANCGGIQVRQQIGPVTFPTQINFPFFPIISNFADHPAVKGLESLFLPFAASISYSPADSSYVYEPLAFSSEMSGSVNAPTFIDINKKWDESDFTQPNQVVALAVNMPSNNAKLAVIANGDFAVNQQGQQVNQDNAFFASNVIDWLSDDTGLIELRTKGVSNRPIKKMEDGKKNALKYLNVLLPILLVLILALIRRQRYLRKRQKWMEGVY